jgi:hypothetical protein
VTCNCCMAHDVSERLINSIDAIVCIYVLVQETGVTFRFWLISLSDLSRVLLNSLSVPASGYLMGWKKFNVWRGKDRDSSLRKRKEETSLFFGIQKATNYTIVYYYLLYMGIIRISALCMYIYTVYILLYWYIYSCF